jgi:hypothetical protein
MTTKTRGQSGADIFGFADVRIIAIIAPGDEMLFLFLLAKSRQTP